jgi:hypothetical protein
LCAFSKEKGSNHENRESSSTYILGLEKITKFSRKTRKTEFSRFSRFPVERGRERGEKEKGKENARVLLKNDWPDWLATQKCSSVKCYYS